MDERSSKVSRYRRKTGQSQSQRRSQTAAAVTKNTAEMLESSDNDTVLKDLGIAKILHHLVGYFRDGAVTRRETQGGSKGDAGKWQRRDWGDVGC